MTGIDAGLIIALWPREAPDVSGSETSETGQKSAFFFAIEYDTGATIDAFQTA